MNPSDSAICSLPFASLRISFPLLGGRQDSPICLIDALVQFQFDNSSEYPFLPFCISFTRDLKWPVARRTSREVRMKEVLGVVDDNTYCLERLGVAACDMRSPLFMPT